MPGVGSTVENPRTLSKRRSIMSGLRSSAWKRGEGPPHPPMAEDRIPRTFVGPFLGSTDVLPSQDRHEAAEQTGPIRIGVRLGRVEFYGPAQVP
jgi:hypothetical protein